MSSARNPAASRRPFKPTLAALLVLSALQPAFAATVSNDEEKTLTVEASAAGQASQAATDYSVPVTSSNIGPKMALSLRDIPQSVSIISKQRIQDQNLTTIGDVLNNTTGVSANSIDSERVSFWSRGNLINNYLFDGVPTIVDSIWDFGETAGDTAIYDRVEVIRGANALSTGSGYPSASVNMVRKHADSKVVTGSLTAETGSWDKQRYVGDITVPLNDAGTVRARAIGGYQEADSWLDRYHKRKRFLSTSVDADLTDSTTLTLGWDYQSSETRDPTWGGLPVFYSDGSRTHYRRGLNAAADWAYSDKESNKYYANLVQKFDNGWQARLNGAWSKTTFDTKQLYASGFPDKTTGQGVTASTGWNKGTRKVSSVDLYANGPFELLGRNHELMLGGSYSKQDNFFFNSWSDLSKYSTGDYSNWNGDITQGSWTAWTPYADDTIRQKSLYSAARFSLADPLSLLVGARYTQWAAHGTTGNKENDKIAPYAGLTYDLNETYSVYASYTSIFQPNNVRNIEAKYLEPTTGKSYETGIKGDWNNSRLTANLSLFRTEQNNLAVNTYGYVPGTTEYAWKAVDSVTRGVEFEVNGALTDNWQMTFGASRYIAEERNGTAVSSQLPRTTAKLFTSYRLPMLQDLTVGGGVNWQNQSWQDVTGPTDSEHLVQGSYALVNLFSRYQVTKQLSVQANVNNLFDKEYYDYLGEYALYGAPRNFSVSANYNF